MSSTILSPIRAKTLSLSNHTTPNPSASALHLVLPLPINTNLSPTLKSILHRVRTFFYHPPSLISSPSPPSPTSRFPSPSSMDSRFPRSPSFADAYQFSTRVLHRLLYQSNAESINDTVDAQSGHFHISPLQAPSSSVKGNLDANYLTDHSTHPENVINTLPNPIS